MRKTSGFSPYRLAANAVLIAMFVALSMFSVDTGAGIKITFDSLPVVIAAVLFGPVDGFLVGFLGATMEQLIHYGITVTTLLWVLPPACRGLAIGLGRKLVPGRRIWGYYGICVVAALLTSCLNTVVYYIDAKIFGYYTFALIFGVFFIRLASGVLTGLVTAALAHPVLAALRKLGFPGKDRT